MFKVTRQMKHGFDAVYAYSTITVKCTCLSTTNLDYAHDVALR